MSETTAWYVVKQSDGRCAIATAAEVESITAAAPDREQWGPFASQGEAIARRVGLIRAGKCQPS